MTQTVICLKWGTRYGPEYVNRLYSMVTRHTERDLRFICITDDSSGIENGVEIMPMPAFTLPEFFRYRPFRRMFIWQDDFCGLSGHILHFDLDLVVTGSIDGFFDHEPDCAFVSAENWTQFGQSIANMSVFRFRIGSNPHLWSQFEADPMKAFNLYRNSQTYVSRNVNEMAFYPREWCLSFKHSLMPTWPLNLFVTPSLPKGTKVVVFTGKPDPDEAIEGRWPREHWYHHSISMSVRRPGSPSIGANRSWPSCCLWSSLRLRIEAKVIILPHDGFLITVPAQNDDPLSFSVRCQDDTRRVQRYP